VFDFYEQSIKSDGTNKYKPVYMSHVILNFDIYVTKIDSWLSRDTK